MDVATDGTVDDMVDVEAAESDIAIVGMAGRFPGARSADELWRRVVAGEDCLVDLSRPDLEARGVPARLLDDDDYVRRTGVLDGIEMFDAGFFGVGPRDAQIMDPQHRHFIECCWEALETSAHVPERFGGAIGLFAGCGMNTYMLNNLLTNPDLVENVGMFLLRHTANDKDFLTTTVSYKLDLRGPSINVQTACSTSLVAVHLAVQSLLSFECDLALAGGVTIEVPHGVGYTYREGEVLSADGHCRAFDERSGGTVLTSGAAVVALRRLADAIADGDEVLAVVKGTAVNNDGQRKVGYLAPSVDGHADVVKEALAVAGLSARDIQLLEAHGTGTAVGDPIEVAALTEAFRDFTPDTGFCRLVSTKPNIGHLDTAAGVASLIKVVQALRHRTLPPLANHTAPSPLLNLPRTPFVIGTEAAPWPGDRPRRAGVSSLGVGGTNAHVIVQEPPRRASSPPAEGEQILVLSARSGGALNELAGELAGFLESGPDTNLADVAHTLATGRRAHAHRRVVVASTPAEAAAALRANDRNRIATVVAPDAAPRVAFMFPGGGSQYVGMAAGLDETFDVYHASLRAGAERVRTRMGVDLGPLLAPDADEDELQHATAFMPAIFTTSVALARQWMAWGVNPTAFVGHSLGEYAAAHLAGVLTYDGALDLIAARARLIEEISGTGAAMMAVPLSEGDVRAVLPGSLSIATVNASDECTVAGPADDILALRDRLAEDDIVATVVPISAAGHSSMLDPILPAFRSAVERVELSAPQVPYVSNLTGTWITAEQATDPQYWVDHLRHTVRFAECLSTLLVDGPTVLMELGPGHSLSSYARRQPTKPIAAIPALRHPNQQMDDTAYTRHAFARSWAAGVDVDVARFAGPDRRTVRLPGYPFAREAHWIEPGNGAISTGASRASTPVASVEAPITPGVGTLPESQPRRIAAIADSFWAPTWSVGSAVAPAVAPVGPWVIVGDPADAFVAALAGELSAHGGSVEVTSSPSPATLVAARSVVLVGPTSGIDAAVERWLTTGSAAARALGDVEGSPTLLAAVTRGATDASGVASAPHDAMALGIIGTAPREYPELRTMLVDVDPTAVPVVAARAVVDELVRASDRVVAHTGGHRLVPSDERLTVGPVAPDATFRRGGTYLVTGGLGGVGFAVAEHLARAHEANLVIVASRTVPAGVERSEWLAHHGYDDPTSRRIRRLVALETVGTKVTVVTADLADPASVRAALDEAERHVAHLDGAVHAAGELRDKPIELATHDDHEVVIGAKARGALTLVDELRRRGASDLVLISSTSTVLTPEGQTAYVAANSVLDALAGAHGDLRVRTLNYGLWAELGVAADAARRTRLAVEPGFPVTHPVLSELSTDRDGTVHLLGTLATDHHWLLDEHRTTAGVAVLPGTGHLELMLAALAAAGAPDATLRDVTLLEPLVVPDEVPVNVRVTIAGTGDERSAHLESDGGVGSWRVHSEARVGPPAGPSPSFASDDRPSDAVDADPLARPSSQVEFGPRWSSVGAAWRHGSVTGGHLALPVGFRSELDAWRAHPALVDVATAYGVLLGDRVESLYVPIGYDSVTSYSALPAEPLVRAVVADGSSDEVLRVDITLGDGAGNVALQIDGLSLRPIHEPAALAIPSAVHDAGVHVQRMAPLVALAEQHGIRAADGVELLERFLGTGRTRLIASSIELDVLLAMMAPPIEPPEAPPAGTIPATAPGSVVATIRKIWVDLLGVPEVADDDDFFDIGGHSLIAIRLMSRIHKELGTRFQLATIFEAPTIAALAARVLEQRPDLDAELAAAAMASSTTVGVATPVAGVASNAAPVEKPGHQSLVTISAAGDKQPIFIVHGAGGNVLFLWSLARAMAGARPIYGFQAHGVDGSDMPDATVEEMAARYIGELRAKHRGPYLLGGYSGGGIVTFEMVRQLQALGEEVRFVVLFDSVPPGRAVVPTGRQLRNLLANIRRHGLTPLRPYIEARFKESVRRFLPAGASRVQQLEQDERELGIRDVEDLGFVNLFYYFSASADRYEMTSIDVDALVLKAEWVWPVQPHDYYWGRHITGHLEVAEVPGDHNAMFYPENAPRLAAVLQQALEQRGL